MTYEKMKEDFAGKWILVTNCEYTQYNSLIGGIPVAVADTVFEGHRDGFYDEFKDPKYAPRTDKDFDYDSVPGIQGLFSTIEMVGEKVHPYN
jgi:hypothetical protein